MNNFFITVQDGRLAGIRDTDINEIRKSAAAAGRRLFRTTAVRMVMKGRDQMDANEKFRNGGVYVALLPETIEVAASAEAVREIRERLLKSGNPDACAEFDAGRAKESDIVAALGGEEFVKSGGVSFDPEEDEVDRDADGNLIEAFHKGGDDTAPELLRRSYGAFMREPGTDLQKAVAELDELCRKAEEK